MKPILILATAALLFTSFASCSHSATSSDKAGILQDSLKSFLPKFTDSDPSDPDLIISQFSIVKDRDTLEEGGSMRVSWITWNAELTVKKDFSIREIGTRLNHIYADGGHGFGYFGDSDARFFRNFEAGKTYKAGDIIKVDGIHSELFPGKGESWYCYTLFDKDHKEAY